MSSHLSWRSPTPLPHRLSQCLAKPCWSATLLYHHHAVVLLLDGVFLNLSLSLLDQGVGDVTGLYVC